MTRNAIRLATAQDLPIVLEIRNEAVAYKTRRGDFAWGKAGWKEEDARLALDQGGFYVIEHQGLPAGMLSLLWQDEEYWGPRLPDAGYLHRLSVRDAFRGRGLGGYAIGWCADQVRINRRRHLRLDCDVRNTKLCAYYEALGFRRVSTQPISADYVASLYERPV
ncbi:GNAT family N-acetyltransferase [Bordetella bronchialis]|uniref:GNAT family N-acetyltransferase n=1 Tax=Bordetella bronchialis TaxID=463025 RepID=UPI003D03C664